MLCLSLLYTYILSSASSLSGPRCFLFSPPLWDSALVCLVTLFTQTHIHNLTLWPNVYHTHNWPPEPCDHFICVCWQTMALEKPYTVISPKQTSVRLWQISECGETLSVSKTLVPQRCCPSGNIDIFSLEIWTWNFYSSNLAKYFLFPLMHTQNYE